MLLWDAGARPPTSQIVHADCGEVSAEAAVRQMLSWECPWFRVEPVPALLGRSSQEGATPSEPLS